MSTAAYFAVNGCMTVPCGACMIYACACIMIAVCINSTDTTDEVISALNAAFVACACFVADFAQILYIICALQIGTF